MSDPQRREFLAAAGMASLAALGGRRLPQGYGHSIENVGSGPARILIGFNTGIYETIDLSQWLAANPKDVLATNFGQPVEMFGKFPDRDVFIVDKNGTR